MSTRRMALFGGSFDPVHLGHIEIARRAVEAMELDEVRFLPCKLSPHKLDRPPASADDRVEMLRLATQGLPWATIDDSELQEPPPSYSHLTAERIHLENPDSRLFWLLGKDQWESLPRWREPEKLRELLEFLVFSRDGTPVPRDGWRMHMIEGVHPASSSAVRNAFATGQDIANWLPKGVADHIKNQHLYL